MKIFQWLQNIVQYLANGVSQLFKPSDDDYPEIGVQPFEGEPYDENKQNENY
ncbi:MAG: isochorismate synthase [Xenococcus sp. MO_188.B8]|nr:isochorismate synthase [Xenococcus sp. MO_188.B8]